MPLITIDDIRAAQSRIAGVVTRTPLLALHRDAGVFLKPENFQPIGSFKIRGAFNAVAALDPTQRKGGVIAYSSGNHAQGVAFAARAFGIHAAIVMPENAPAIKLESTRALGAEVITYNPLHESREEVTESLIAKFGYSLVPPFNHAHVIAGQGTIGLEILEDLPNVDLVLTPVGGGGLISGIAVAIKTLRPSAKVIGVEPALAADAQASLRSGSVVKLSAAEAARTVADGVRTLFVGDLTFAHMQQYVDDIVTVSEVELIAAMRELVLEAKITVEPTSALPLAAWRFHRHELPAAKQTVIVISGGSVDPAQLSRLIYPQ